MQTIPEYGTCPTCGQSLIDETMLKRVARARATAERAARAKLRAEIESDVEETKEAKYADRMARLAARVDQLQRQLDTRNSHDRGARHEQDVTMGLRAAFPADRIDRDGRKGDILHTIIQDGRDVGMILYECKNAAAWQHTWLGKLKQDGRNRHTPYLILVTRTMPAKQSGLCVRDDVVICEPDRAVAVAMIVRRWVIATHRTSSTSRDVPEKARRLYNYLAGE